jgi:hypothetical protein
MTKSILLSFILFLFQLQASAQTVSSVQADFNSGVLLINGTTFANTSTLQEWEEVLGKAERTIKVAGVDRVFIYDSQGISFTLAEGTDTVQDIALMYIPGTSRKEAKETYKGKVFINGTEVNAGSSPDEISTLAGIELVSHMPDIYMGEGEALKLAVLYHEGGFRLIAFSF